MVLAALLIVPFGVGLIALLALGTHGHWRTAGTLLVVSGLMALLPPLAAIATYPHMPALLGGEIHTRWRVAGDYLAVGIAGAIVFAFASAALSAALFSGSKQTNGIA